MDEINFICTTNAAQVGAQFSAPASSEIVTEDGTNHGSPAQAPLSPAPPANLALSPARKPTTVSRTMSPPVAVSSSLLDRLREANDRAALLEDVMSGLPENHWETTQGELDLLKVSGKKNNFLFCFVLLKRKKKKLGNVPAVSVVPARV